MKRILFIIMATLLVGTAPHATACTSAVVSGRVSASGRPMLWKHRDTGAANNFIEHVSATDSTLAFTALFNGGDTALAEAWTGFNERGFAIMNTASYNLAPDTAVVKDREGAVMALALGSCVTVDDFERLLSRLPKPLGVQANFGVIDSLGSAAYFEVNDWQAVRFDADAAPEGYLVRTNFSVSGQHGEGSGYIRYRAATRLMTQSDTICPELFTEGLSRSFYHGLTEVDYLAADDRYVADRDFIPRDISTASIVIEGGAEPVMWAVPGYPPCGAVYRVTLTDIPDDWRPIGPGYTSPACTRSMELRRGLRPFDGGSGKGYIDLERLRPIVEEMHRASMDTYRKQKK